MAAWQLIKWYHPSGFARCCMPMQNQPIQNKMATTHFYTQTEHEKTGLLLTPYISLALSLSLSLSKCHQKILINSIVNVDIHVCLALSSNLLVGFMRLDTSHFC
jgi:hypothetical protein